MAKNEALRTYLKKLIPGVYQESISEEDLNTLIDVICSAYDELTTKIADLQYLYDADYVDTTLLPYIGYLLGFKYDQSLGTLSAYLNQDILRRSQVKNAVAWQKLKGSKLGINQFLLTLTLDSVIKELYYDSTYQNLIEEKIVTSPIYGELWQKEINENSIDYFEGNNGIDTSKISEFFQQVVKGNVIFNPAVDGTFKVHIYQKRVSDDSIVYKTEIEQSALSGNNFIYSAGSPELPTLPNLNNQIIVDLGTASIAGTVQGPFVFLTGTNDTLSLDVDGITQSVTFITGTYNASVVANQINNQTTGITATITTDQRLVITSDRNAYNATFSILSHPTSCASTLGLTEETITASIRTKFSSADQYLEVQLREPHDFTKFWTSNITYDDTYGEIRIDYEYNDYDNNPDTIKEWDYSTGSKSNWFDIEITSSSPVLVLNSEDVTALVEKVKRDVKPLHALLRSIKFITGFEDNWISPGDQPSFKKWTDRCDINPETLFNDKLDFNVNSCECQCCLLHDNCVKKLHNGLLRHNWASGAIKHDFNPCIPGTLLITHDGYITSRGTRTPPEVDTSGINSTFTYGTDTVLGGLDYTDLVVPGDYVGIDGIPENGIARVIGVDVNTLTLEMIWLGPTMAGALIVYRIGKLTATGPVAYQHKLTYIVNDIIPPQDKIIVYRDGRKYYNSHTGKEDCVFHYDLGELPRAVGQNDEYYTITPTTNELVMTVNGNQTRTVILPSGTYDAEYIAELINFSVLSYLEFYGDGVAYIPQHSDLDVGTGDFTIEFMFAQGNTDGYIWKKRDYVIPRQGYFVYMGLGYPQLWLCDNAGNTINNSVNHVLTGNVNLTANSTVVTGSGTAFLTELRQGDRIKRSADPDSCYAVVQNVINDTSATLAAQYTGLSGTGPADIYAKFNRVIDNSFHRCTISVERNDRATCYIDGEFAGSFDVSSYSAVNLDNTLDAFIGAYPGSGFWTGKIFDIRLFKGVAIDQAAALDWRFKRLDSNHPYWSYLKAYYKINEGTGLTFSNTILGGPGNGIISTNTIWINPGHQNWTSTIPTWEAGGDLPIVKAFGIPDFLRILALSGWDPLTETKSTLDISGSALPVFDFSPLDTMTLLPHSESKVCALLYNPGQGSRQYADLPGTVTFTNGSKNVSGTSCFFLSWVVAGDKVRLSTDTFSDFAIVDSVTDNNNLVLMFDYGGTGGTGTGIRLRTTNVYNYDDAYKELPGSATFTSGSPNVSATGAAFMTWIRAGDNVKLSGDANSAFGIVASVTDDDNLVLANNYTGTGGTGATIRVRNTTYVLGSSRTEKDMLQVGIEPGL